jgi:ribosomal protein S18 acetylase RimI-like enzyme
LEIEEVGTPGPRFTEVLDLHRANRQVLGFLPDEGFRDRALQGTLLVAVDDGRVVGYVLYDLPNDIVKIVHLCVARSCRRSGAARELIEHLDRRHSERRCLQLACRRDFPASKLWPKLGFTPVAERTGRSRAGHPLTVWQRSHDHADLFTLPDERRKIAAIDCNVFKDLTSTRPQGSASRHLRDDWVTEMLELRVTEELFHEINRCEDRALRERMLHDASGFGRLPSASGAWRPLVARVASLASTAGESDHRHVARAIVGNASYFVTRDGQLLKVAGSLREAFGLLVARPEEVIQHLDRQRYTGGYEPQALQATSINRIEIQRVSQDRLVEAFLNYGAGERAGHLRQILQPVLATPHEHEFLVFEDGHGRLLGALAMQAADHQIDVKLMRVGSSGRLGAAVGRQLAFLPRREAANRRIIQIVVSDPSPTACVREALREEFYTGVPQSFACEVRRGLVAPPPIKDEDLRLASIAERERRLWPQKLLGAIPTFMIPIHPTFAAALFETNLAAGTLFGRDLDLGLSREHVYYRSCGWSGGIRTPARLLWYVKGSRRTGQGYLAATSALLEISRGRPRSLHQRFTRLGVWSRQEVEDATGNTGEVMALRFADTELLANPIQLSELRALYDSAGLQFQAPQSPRIVPEHMFYLLYRRSSAYAT